MASIISVTGEVAGEALGSVGHSDDSDDIGYDEDAARHLASNPRQLTFVSEVVLPGLAKRGLSAPEVRALMVDNPRRWLAGA
jgi:hypothetical protein